MINATVPRKKKPWGGSVVKSTQKIKMKKHNLEEDGGKRENKSRTPC